MEPKVLVISNECFSQTSSNGRTLGNFFVNWPKQCLAQFFLSGKPDTSFCSSFFQTSDAQALNALLGRKNIGGIIAEQEKQAAVSSTSAPKKPSRNALTMLIRDVVWKSRAWEKNGYWKWVQNFAPDIVLLQAGDCPFMFELAVKTARRQNARFVIYNSEGYYYKGYDYFRSSGIAHLLYPAFRYHLKKSLEKAYTAADCVFYICDELREAYSRDFHGRAETVFTGSDVRFEPKEAENKIFTTVYCGNLGLKRHESLIQIAEELQSISKELYVDVYGKAPDENVGNALRQCTGIRYHGMVPYEKVRQLLRDSDLLLYVESFDAFYQEDTRFGFSTKLADSLSSGNCFLLYAPEHFACYQYLKKNHAAYTACNRQELHDILDELVHDPKARVRYQRSALALAARNHQIARNTHKFQSILLEIVK